MTAVPTITAFMARPNEPGKKSFQLILCGDAGCGIFRAEGIGV
jgi:hypothetical protein